MEDIKSWRNVCCDRDELSSVEFSGNMCQLRPISSLSRSSISKKTKDIPFQEKKIPSKVIKVNTSTTNFTNKQYQEHYPYLGTCLNKKKAYYPCDDLVQQVRSLLKEINLISEENTVCDHCAEFDGIPKCERCRILSKRFKTDIDKRTRQQQFKIWLGKVRQVLYTIFEKETNANKVHEDSTTTDELTRLLNELKTPLSVPEPCIENFPSIDSLENITENNNILEQVLFALKSKKHSTSPETLPSSYIYKQFAEKNSKKNLPATGKQEMAYDDLTFPSIPHTHEKVESKKIREVSESTTVVKDLLKTKVLAESKEKSKNHQEKIPIRAIGKYDGAKKRLKTSKSVISEEALISSVNKKGLDGKRDSKNIKTVKEDNAKNTNKKLTSLEALILSKVKENKPKREEKPFKLPPIPSIPDLPTLPSKHMKIVEEESVSSLYIECHVMDTEPACMVKGTKIVPIETRDKISNSIKPLLFKVNSEWPKVEKEIEQSANTETTGTFQTDNIKKSPRLLNTQEQSAKGVIKYMLSNRDFIEKGWTKLPTTKIVRRMNIYKMLPASTFEWFERNKYNQTNIMYYGSGEKLAEIVPNGSGKLFYKNGMLAMSYFSSNVVNAGQRCIIYSSGEKDIQGRSLPVTVLAIFDYDGNAVVYDHYGNERLKYNQSEGMLFDKKIGAPGRWKWHNLNDPPNILPVYADKRLKDPCLQAMASKVNVGNNIGNRLEQAQNLDMLAIELENFVKQKAHKLLQKFKPFQIKSKAMKLNEQFALKVLDQARIFLVFSDAHSCVRINLGMMLVNNEIVDTHTYDATGVYTPYDKQPPKTQFEVDIQNFLEKAKRLGKSRDRVRY